VKYVDFVINATHYYGSHRNEQRFGQAVFNVLHSMRPDIADELRGTEIDPYYQESVPEGVWAFIKARW
jgi:hypothetical protein